jgi:hypothetical protein
VPTGDLRWHRNRQTPVRPTRPRTTGRTRRRQVLRRQPLVSRHRRGIGPVTPATVFACRSCRGARATGGSAATSAHAAARPSTSYDVDPPRHPTTLTAGDQSDHTPGRRTSRRPRRAHRRRSPNDDAALPRSDQGAHRRCGSREICAHLELATGRQGRQDANPEPWATDRAPGFFDASRRPAPRTHQDQEPRGPSDERSSTEARGSSRSRTPSHHHPGAPRP